MPLTRDHLCRIRDILWDYEISNATAARVSEQDARCLPAGENKTFFEKEAARLRAEAAAAGELSAAITEELKECAI